MARAKRVKKLEPIPVRLDPDERQVIGDLREQNALLRKLLSIGLAQQRLMINFANAQLSASIKGSPANEYERGYMAALMAVTREGLKAEEVLEETAPREQLLERARIELEEWRRHYHELNEFTAVFDAIDRSLSRDS
jgi:hypothetical protein